MAGHVPALAQVSPMFVTTLLELALHHDGELSQVAEQRLQLRDAIAAGLQAANPADITLQVLVRLAVLQCPGKQHA